MAAQECAGLKLRQRGRQTTELLQIKLMRNVTGVTCIMARQLAVGHCVSIARCCCCRHVNSDDDDDVTLTPQLNERPHSISASYHV